MTATSMTSDLIARLEQATEGSRELDVAVAYAVHGDAIERFAAERERHGQPPVGEGYRPTRSIDAALTLVPEGWYVIMERYSDGWYVGIKRDSSSHTAFLGIQKPAALALCIAALRARSSNVER